MTIKVSWTKDGVCMTERYKLSHDSETNYLCTCRYVRVDVDDVSRSGAAELDQTARYCDTENAPSASCAA